MLAAVGQTKAVFDLNADWSDLINPNGVWTYREGTNALPSLANISNGSWALSQPAWSRGVESPITNVNLPAWIKSNGSETFVHDWLTDDVVVHTHDLFNGVGNGLANVIWKSPIASRINISGAVWMGRDIGRGNDWRLFHNDQLLTDGGIFSGDSFDRADPLDYALGSGGSSAIQSIAVSVGDIIKLELERTSTFGDFVGVNLAINVIPEPADFAIWFLFGTLTMIVAVRWRRKTAVPGTRTA